MSKIPVRMFRLPLISLTGQPYRAEEGDKNFWVNFQFLGEEFAPEELAILDSGRSFRVKAVKTSEGKQKLQFKGLPEKALSTGMKLYESTWPVLQERRAYLVPLGAQNQTFKAEKGQLKSALFEGGLPVEVRRVEGPDDKFLIQVSALRRFPCLTGQFYTLELSDGQVLDVALVVCGALEPRDLADFVKKTFRFPGLPSVNALYSISLRVRGWVVLPPPLAEDEFEEADGEGGVRIMTKAFAHFQKKARNAAAQPGGISSAALQEKMALPEPVFHYLTERLMAENVLRKKEGWFLPVGDPLDFLSPVAKKALSQLDGFGMRGVDLANESSELFKRTYAELARMDLAVETETPWVYGLTGWDQIKALLCGQNTLGKEWKIADVKEVLDTTRKPLLGILNTLEAQGFLERKEDYRLVVKEFLPS